MDAHILFQAADLLAQHAVERVLHRLELPAIGADRIKVVDKLVGRLEILPPLFGVGRVGDGGKEDGVAGVVRLQAGLRVGKHLADARRDMPGKGQRLRHGQHLGRVRRPEFAHELRRRLRRDAFHALRKAARQLPFGEEIREFLRRGDARVLLFRRGQGIGEPRQHLPLAAHIERDMPHAVQDASVCAAEDEVAVFAHEL